MRMLAGAIIILAGAILGAAGVIAQALVDTSAKYDARIVGEVAGAIVLVFGAAILLTGGGTNSGSGPPRDPER